MSATDWSLVLIWVGAVAATSFVLLYGVLRPWWISPIGRALLISSLGLTLLFDLSVFVHYHPFTLSAAEANWVVAVPVLGACLKFLALLLDLHQTGWKRQPWRRRG